MAMMADRLDRDAVARILDRAHQLESVHAADHENAMEHGIGPDALIEAAAEVGIDPNAVRDSLALERLDVDLVPARRLDRFAGPVEVVIERNLELPVDQVVEGIEAWLTSVHRLLCDRRSPSTLHGRGRTDVSAQLGRLVASARGDGRLSVSSLVVEAVPQTVGTAPGHPRTFVRIRANRSTPRSVRLGGGGVIGGIGVAGGAVAAVGMDAVFVMPVVAVPLVAGGYVVARTGSGQADRLELQLERLLSMVERGERPTGLLGRVARRARAAALPRPRQRR